MAAKTRAAPAAKARRRKVNPDAAEAGQARGATEKNAARRQAILAVAAKIFAEKGFEATSIRDIGDAAGLLSGSLYYYFETKEDILQELIRDFIIDLLKNYERLAKAGKDAEDSLRQMVTFALTKLLENQDRHAIIFNDRKFLARREGFRYIGEIWQDIGKIWYGVLQEGVRSGKFQQDMNISLTLTIILEMISATVNWYSPRGRHPIPEVVEGELHFMLRAIRA